MIENTEQLVILSIKKTLNDTIQQKGTSNNHEYK